MSESLKLEKVLGKARNRVYLVGLELEGGWKDLPDGVVLQRDGSVQVPTHQSVPVTPEAFLERVRESAIRQGFSTTRTAAMVEQERVRIQHDPPYQSVAIHVGELPSEPLELSKFPTWMRRYYPSHVNESCGLHVHMSFKSALHYQQLMVPEYPATMVAYITKWAKDAAIPKEHPIWKRLNGKNQFCKQEFFADQQVAKMNKNYGHDGVGHRYTVINYCYGLHATLECRVLPMLEDAEVAIKAVQHVIDVTNAFLVTRAKREEKLKADVVVDHRNDTYREDREEYV